MRGKLWSTTAGSPRLELPPELAEVKLCIDTERDGVSGNIRRYMRSSSRFLLIARSLLRSSGGNCCYRGGVDDGKRVIAPPNMLMRPDRLPGPNGGLSRRVLLYVIACPLA